MFWIRFTLTVMMCAALVSTASADLGGVKGQAGHVNPGNQMSVQRVVARQYVYYVSGQAPRWPGLPRSVVWRTPNRVTAYAWYYYLRCYYLTVKIGYGPG